MSTWVGCRELVLASVAASTLVGCGSALSGFATGLTDVELEPVSAFEDVSRVGRGREVVVGQFVDARLEKDRCGMNKNGYNSDTANVVCPDRKMGNWLSWLFAARLKSAGFAVVAPMQRRSADPLFIQGRLMQLFVEPIHGMVETDMSIHVVARTRSGMTADRTFFEKAAVSNFWRTDGAFQESYEQATQRILTSMTQAVADLLNRHPGMGVPGVAGRARAASTSPAPAAVTRFPLLFAEGTQ
jgi:hypothetical protein